MQSRESQGWRLERGEPFMGGEPFVDGDQRSNKDRCVHVEGHDGNSD